MTTIQLHQEPFLASLPCLRDDFLSGVRDYRELGSGTATVFSADYDVGKEYRLQSGKLNKRTLGALGSCNYGVTIFDDAEDLAGMLASLGPRQVLTASTPRGTAALGTIATKDTVRESPGCITRGKEHFGLQSGQRGLMTVDYDPDGEPLGKSELWAILQESIAGLNDAGVVYWTSSSSGIYTDDGVQLTGVRGQRFYILVTDAGDIPRAMDVLQKRLWLAGRGRFAVSKSGSLLARTIADATLAEDAKLDYAGGAVCRDGLTQRREAPEVLANAGWLDLNAALPNLSAAELQRYDQIVSEARRLKAPEAELQREAWAKDRARTYATKAAAKGEDYADAHDRGIAAANAALRGVLLGDFEVELDDGTLVSVGEILDDKPRYHLRLTKDPLEPDYNGGHVVGCLHLFGAVPNLFSFAHGRTTYRLERQPERVLLRSGRNAGNALTFVRRLADSGEVYAKGGVPVRVQDGLRPLASTAAMGCELGTRFACFKLNARGEEVPADPNDQVIRMVIESAAHDLPQLNGAVDHPFVTERGLVATPGYHEATGTFADFDPGDYDGLSASPSEAELIQALKTLWRPWESFAFAGDNDRAAMMAAILAVVCRPGLDIAPGVLFDAPVAGSGKTLAASCVGALASGVSPPVSMFAVGENDVELKKRLVADSIAGEEVFIYDNVMGYFNSAVLAGVLTSGTLRDRVLGGSVTFSGAGPRHIMLTSNNALLGLDLAVRFLRVRLDHGVANPATRRFDFHPVERVLNERCDVLRSCLIVMRGFLAAGAPHHGNGGYRMAAWDRLVRSAVIWLGRRGLIEAAGIAEAAGEFDPAAGLLAATEEAGSGDEAKTVWLRCLHNYIGDNGLTAGDILTLCKGDRELEEATADVLGGRPLTTANLRAALNFAVDAWYGGLKLSKYQDAENRQLYWVRR